VRRKLIQLGTTLIVTLCIWGHVSELFDHWDNTFRTGYDIEYSTVIVVVVAGAVIALAHLLVNVIRSDALTNNREVGDAFNTGGLVDPSGRGSSFIEDQGITGSITSILSNTAINSVRFQVSTRGAVLRTADQTAPSISIAGLVDFGRPYNGNENRRENHYELNDVASAAKGRHLLSFGGDLDWIREKVASYDGFGAVYIFPTLDTFLSGQPDEYRQVFANPNTDFTAPRYSGFLQDHWTVTNHLTIDGGLRY